MKNVLPLLCMPAFLLDWVNDNSNLCVYTSMQLAKFPLAHLVAGGWYLYCHCRFVHKVEETLYNSLISSDIELIELEKKQKEDNPTLPSNEKKMVSVKG